MNGLRFVLAGHCFFVHLCSGQYGDRVAVGSRCLCGQTVPCPEDTVTFFALCLCASMKFTCVFIAKLARASVELFCYFGVEPKNSRESKTPTGMAHFWQGHTGFLHAGFEKRCRVFPFGWETFAGFFKLVVLW